MELSWELWWLYTLAIIGGIVLVRLLDKAVDFLQFHTSTPSKPLEGYRRIGDQPTYALVTSAADGMGFGIAQALLKRGFGVILLDHRPAELASAVARLENSQTPGGDLVKSVVMDAQTAAPADMVAAVQSTILDPDLQVSILVNNSAELVPPPGLRELSTYSPADIDSVVDANARFVARLTTLMLPILRWRITGDNKFGTHQRSLILNVTSDAMAGMPFSVVDGASKVFTRVFSLGLARELEADPESSHMDCLAVIAGDVRRQEDGQAISKRLPEADVFGECVVRKVDGALSRGWREMRPFWWHDVQNYILGIMPEGRRTKEIAKRMAKKKAAWKAMEKKQE